MPRAVLDSGSAGSRRRRGATWRGRRAVLAAVALGALAQGCEDDGPALLLNLRAPAQITSLSFKIKQYLPDGDTVVYGVPDEPIPASEDGYIATVQGVPLHLNVELEERGRYAIHIVGTLVPIEGETQTRVVVATVCQAVDGVVAVERDIFLGWLPQGADDPESLDVDSDTFPEDVAAFCRLQASEWIACETSCNTPEYAAMADCNPDATAALPPGCAGYGPPETWNPFVWPDTCGDCHDQDCWGGDEPCGDRDGDGWAANVDCDDANPAINPGADEVCGNGIDENCALDVAGCDDGDLPCDRDGDGAPGRLSDAPGCGNDCDDEDPAVHPGAFEGCGADPSRPDACPGCPPEDTDRTDDDCDGYIDEACFSDDLDDDGVPSATDCNDCNAAIGPGFDERCGDEVDQDCRDGDQACHVDDVDGDGVTAAAGDCDDGDDRVYPGAPDYCGDEVVQDCVLERDCSEITDVDGDHFAPGAGDCDDTSAAAGPWALEACDPAGVDEDCDGRVNEVDGAAALDGGCVLSGDAWEPVSFASDPDHCGECRHRCCTGACDCRGDACTNGECTCNGEAECAGGVGSFCCGEAGCRNLAADVEHCGGCGIACAQGEICVAGGECDLGHCECPGAPLGCDEGEDCCPSVGCVDLDHDVHNCGACGNDCTVGDGNGPRGDLCDEGICYCERVGSVCRLDTWCTAVTEPDGESCGCVDLDHDVSNCGGCGESCGENEVCSGGECVCEVGGPACRSDETCCPGVGCVNLDTDGENCGGCGLSCGDGGTCSDGSCTCGGTVCDGDQYCCAGRCHRGTCCWHDDDCWGSLSPDCNVDDHHCFCRPARAPCKNGKVCCSNGCKKSCNP